MTDGYQVTVDGKNLFYPERITLGEIAKERQMEYDAPIVLANVNGRLRELGKKIKAQDEIAFLTVKDRSGFSAYRRSTLLLMLKAIYEVGGFEEVDRVVVHFAVSEGYYITLNGWDRVEASFLEKVKEVMRELIKKDLPIEKKSISTDEAIALFRRLGMEDKEKLFHYRRASRVNIYMLDGFMDYYYGYMVPSTGYLTCFDLIPYDEGFVLQFPQQADPYELPDFRPQEKIFRIQKDSLKWGEKMHMTTVGDLNDRIVNGRIEDLILIQEAAFEKRIADIAETIASHPEKKLIMIAGPSSSGKTTFSHRLSIQLSSHGMTPHPIPMDDYFLNRDQTPLDEEGKPNFECLEALDIELFNRDMSRLLKGEEVELPTFNFRTGKREYNGKTLKLGEHDVLVIEGIHGLNDKLSHSLPKESKYKIYISALTQLNIDEHNRIPTTDGRLLRRIIRDARTRGTSAKKTIAMWPSVRRGEESYIFPNQEEADVMINSAMIYEFAVLKSYAERLLFGIQRSDPEYVEAKRLLKFLDYFVGIPSERVPQNSILREFVGGSCFEI